MDLIKNIALERWLVCVSVCALYVSANPLSMTCGKTETRTHTHTYMKMVVGLRRVQQCRIKNRLNNISVFIKWTRLVFYTLKLMFGCSQNDVANFPIEGPVSVHVSKPFFCLAISHKHSDCVVSRKSKCVPLFCTRNGNADLNKIE